MDHPTNRHQQCLFGLLDEEIYMVQPPGFAALDKTLVYKLNRALYGLKQAPRVMLIRQAIRMIEDLPRVIASFLSKPYLLVL